MVEYTYYGNIARLIDCGLTLIEQYLIDLFSWREPAYKQVNSSEGGRGMDLWMINTITVQKAGGEWICEWLIQLQPRRKGR